MWRMSWCLLCLAAFAPEGKAEQRWKYEESIDDINNTKVRTVAVVGENDKSVLVLRVEEGKKPLLTLVPGVVMFPDKTDAASKSMGIRVTMRSTAMDKPLSAMFRMPWMDYKTAAIPCGKESAKSKVFAGESVTFQLDKAGTRFKFPTTGEGLEGLQDAITKAVEIAADDPPASDASAEGK